MVHRLAAVLVFAGTLFAQTQTAEGEASPGAPTHPAIKNTEIAAKPVSPWKRMPGNLVHDQKVIWTSPFHMRRQDVKWWVGFGALGGALIATDNWTSKQLPNTRDQISVATWTSRAGAAYTLLPVAGAFYFLGAATHNERVRETGILGVEALANALIVDTVIKSATQRERPTEGNGQGRFWQGAGRFWNAGASFPSGHAIETWSLASVIAHEYPHGATPFIAYGLAFSVNASRFAARKHFASDVVIGSVMGYFIGRYVYNKRHNPNVKNASALRKICDQIRIGGGFQTVPPPGMGPYSYSLMAATAGR